MMEHIQKALGKYWGYDEFLPLQKEAMGCISRGSDSIVVLPNGLFPRVSLKFFKRSNCPLSLLTKLIALVCGATTSGLSIVNWGH